MSVLKTLRDTVAPELNHLYTVPPAETPAGIDCGWHGREHALHAFFVARMFGATADIRSGDFAVISRQLPPLTTLERDADHSWCSVNGLAPVDLSMTFKNFGEAPQLRTAITGEGRNGEWEVHYAEDDSLLDENIQAGHELLFIEKKIHADSAEALLGNPYLFLPLPRVEEAAGWPLLYGPVIYAKISLHCFCCAAGGAKSLRNRLTRDQALAWIAGNYSEPEKQILSKLKPGE